MTHRLLLSGGGLLGKDRPPGGQGKEASQGLLPAEGAWIREAVLGLLS